MSIHINIYIYVPPGGTIATEIKYEFSSITLSIVPYRVLKLYEKENIENNKRLNFVLHMQSYI